MLARALNGNRTRTAITGQGIFLLLLLSHKPSLRDVVVWTISSPCHHCGLGVAYIVSTPFISSKAEFSEPSPHLPSPTERFLFVRAILLHQFPDEHSCFVLGMYLSARGSLDKALTGFPFCGRGCHH